MDYNFSRSNLHPVFTGLHISRLRSIADILEADFYVREYLSESTPSAIGYAYAAILHISSIYHHLQMDWRNSDLDDFLYRYYHR